MKTAIRLLNCHNSNGGRELSGRMGAGMGESLLRLSTDGFQLLKGKSMSLAHLRQPRKRITFLSGLTMILC